jgi:hypothetical protein
MLRLFLSLFLTLILLFSLAPTTKASHDPTTAGFAPSTYCDENEIWRTNTSDTGHTFVQYCPSGTTCKNSTVGPVGATRASCEPNSGPGGVSKLSPGPSPAGLTQIENTFKRFITVSVGLAFIALLVILVTASIKILTSGGDPKKLSSAKDAIVWGLLGIVFLAIAWLILQLVAAFTGLDYLKVFNVKTLCVPGIVGCT